VESVDSLYSSLKSPGIPSSAFLRDSELDAKLKEAATLTASRDKTFPDLEALTYSKLSALHSELESLIQVYNEALVQELALKDELEYEKELKNTFISLLLAVQNKRRAFIAEKKRKQTSPKSREAEKEPQYVTAVIPYQETFGSPSNTALQALIKILGAVNENNPNVPAMLTDYILNVVCPSTEGSF